ncbi:ATP-binding cassette domain-containing protein, partial [Amycolatopsis solani]|uniref:ATP-binding cassette domain-containing protein n=1 Tax=Amycolatopsis solani TaxID=3028615 RepID=UPI0025AFF619
MSLTARISAARGTFRLDVDLDVPAGTVLALLGPNGSGKSTVLGCLSGLITPTSAEITVAGRALAGVAPHRRGIGLLSQDALLFPHLSAADNVAFAPRSTGAGRRAARERAYHWLAEVDAVELADRRPGQLSGGPAPP